MSHERSFSQESESSRGRMWNILKKFVTVSAVVVGAVLGLAGAEKALQK